MIIKLNICSNIHFLYTNTYLFVIIDSLSINVNYQEIIQKEYARVMHIFAGRDMEIHFSLLHSNSLSRFCFGGSTRVLFMIIGWVILLALQWLLTICSWLVNLEGEVREIPSRTRNGRDFLALFAFLQHCDQLSNSN